MASSGTIKSVIRTGYAIQIAWNVDSQSVANNTSTVTAKVQLVSEGSSYTINSSASKSGSLTINGTKYTFTFTAALSGNQTKTIFQKTVTVSHNADGTKTCSFVCVAGINVTLGGTYYGNVSASGNGTFNTIARASTIASVTESVAINGTNTVAVTINRAASAFTHTVEYKFGTYSYKQTGIGTSASYAIPLSWINGMPNATPGTATVTVTTYSGSTKIGTAVSKTFKVTVPSTVVPTISSVTVAETVAGIKEQFSAYVQNKSKVRVTISAAGAYSSTIKSYKTTINGSTFTSASFTSGLLTKSGTVAIVTTVTDSRGRTASKTTNITVVAYSAPKINALSGFRCLSDGTEDYDGTFLNAAINYTISSVGSKNASSYKLEYKLKTATSWVTVTSGTGYSANKSIVSTLGIFNINNSYDVKLTITDFFTSASATIDIPTAFTLIDYRASGRGIAFGKVSERDNVVDFGIDAFSSDGQFVRYPRALQTNEDLNNILEAGYYVIGGTAISATILNKPTTATATALIEVLWGGTGVQKFQRYTVCDKNNHLIYQRIYYGNAWGSWYQIDAFQSNWTLLTLESAFANYSSSANNQPRVRRQGSVVSLIGIVTPTASIAGGTTLHTICTLPDGYRPTVHNREFICQGSGACIWNLGVTTAGLVRFSRYRSGDAFTAANANTWLPFHVTYMI